MTQRIPSEFPVNSTSCAGQRAQPGLQVALEFLGDGVFQALLKEKELEPLDMLGIELFGKQAELLEPFTALL